MRQVFLLAPLLLAAACGSKAPPPAVSPATATLAAAPAPAAKPMRGQAPWQNSRFFGQKPPPPAPLFRRPRRPTRGPAVHTLRS